MSKKARAGDPPHLGIAILSSGIMAIALAGGLVILKIMSRLDAMLSGIFVPKGISPPALPLDPKLLWICSAILAFALPAVILNIPGNWRRALVWVASLILTLTWGPVLMLSSRSPEIGVAVVAVLWSGFCAMFYAYSHVLPADKISVTSTYPTDAPR